MDGRLSPLPTPTAAASTASTKDTPALASGVLVASLAVLSLQDALVKLFADAVSLWQFQVLRACFNLGLLALLYGLVTGARRLKPQRLWAVAVRSALLVGAMLLFFGGIPNLSLAEIAAGLYVFPLFVALLSKICLGEAVGIRRLLAILVGFTGTLLILKPGTVGFSPMALMPIGAALCYAGTILATRRLCRQESPIVLAMGVGIAFLIAGGAGSLAISVIQPAHAATWPYLLGGWHPIDAVVLGLIALCSGLNLAANIGLAKAYQSAEASWLAPFDYTYLLFATLWGYVFFGTLPDGLTIGGMTLIAVAGLTITWTEHRGNRHASMLGRCADGHASRDARPKPAR